MVLRPAPGIGDVGCGSRGRGTVEDETLSIALFKSTDSPSADDADVDVNSPATFSNFRLTCGSWSTVAIFKSIVCLSL